MKRFSKSNALVSIYALLITFSISIIALHSIQFLSIKKNATISLYFQKQSILYAQTLKEIAITCIKNKQFDLCKQDSISFDSYFSGEYYAYRISNDLILLDISIYSQTLLSTHPLRFAKRFVLRGF